MRTLYPFGWIDRDLKELGFLRDMSASAAKLYILYVLAGGIEGKSCYSAKALIEATGLSKATIYRARQELEAMGLVVARKEMVRGHKNKKPKVWVELQDLPVNKIEIKKRRAIPLVIARQAKSLPKQSHYKMQVWMQLGAERLRKRREGNV
jgi:DNA-binding transcriptional MocR family regulator